MEIKAFLYVFVSSICLGYAFGAGTAFLEPSSCGLTQYFDSNTMMCQQCGTDLMIANDSLSCVCRPGFVQNTTTFEAQLCSSCNVGAQQVISASSTCIRCPGNLIIRDGKCDCPVGQIQLEFELNGRPKETRECLGCYDGYVANEQRTQCISCKSPNLSIELMAACIDKYCPTQTGSPASQFCLQIDQSFRMEETTLTSLAVGSQNNRINSAYFLEYHRLIIAYTLCTKLVPNSRKASYCSLVANLCTLRASSADLERTDKICAANSVQDAERMIISDLEAETKLPPISFVTDRTREMSAAGNIYSYLDLRAAIFNINGTFEGWRNASDGFLQLCQNKQRFPDAWLGFGVNYVVKCQIPARDLWTKFETKFYQLYIVFPERDERTGRMITKKFIIPVRMTSPFGGEARNLLSRFFIVDKDSLRQTETLPPSQTLRYAAKITLLVRVNGTDGILPPQLRITFKDHFRRNIDNMVEIEFAVNYEGSGATFDDIVKMLLISLIAVGFYVGVKLYGWFQRRGGDCDQAACLLPSFGLIIAGGGNVLCVVALAISIWYLIAYKFQNFAVFMLPSKDDGERAFVVVCIAALVCKFVHCIQIIIQQSTIDVFFLDWEQPKLSQVVSLASAQPATPSGPSTPAPRGSIVRNQPRPNTSDQRNAPVREHLHPVSVWRTLFIGNEWNELQIIRRTNPAIQFFAVMALIEYIGLGNLATGDPYVDTNLSPQYYHSEFRRVLRFGITSAMYVVFGVAQWLFFMFIYERWVADAARNFVDLCALSNISVFILAEQRHGYYIHGRLLHGHADTSQKELAEFLKSEARDESPKGGLFGSTQRTFEIMVPLRIRTTIDSYLTQIKQASGPKQRSVRGNPAHPSTDYTTLQAAQESLKFFISNEVEKNGTNTGVVLRTKKSFMENIFDIECLRSQEGMVFYEDDGRSFENVLLLGHELTLFMFELLLFSVIDMFTYDATLSGLITYVVSQLLLVLRGNFGEKNVALKTGVDERFLI